MDTHDYNPDILNCLANLSSDEVFTPPELANQMLDLLPQDLFSNPNMRFLDPCSKSGVFLREITKRLIRGLETTIPDLQERVNHILQKQVFGIALTQLTAEMSRRTLYCTKRANSQYSVATMPTADGMVYFQRLRHLWKDGRCTCCGANEEVYQRGEKRENYACPFIHQPFNEIYNMQFDVIIGNPPYQLNDGGGTGSSAMPIYQYFVQTAIKLNPRYLCMIIPSRWFAGGKGLDEFRKEMLQSGHISTIVDFANSADCFPGVIIAGGVNYFLWRSEYQKACKVVNRVGDKIVSEAVRPLNAYDVFVRDNTAVNINNTIRTKKENTLDTWVHSRNCFNLLSKEIGHPQHRAGDCILYSLNGQSYISQKDITDRDNLLLRYKVMMTKAMSGGNKPASDGKYTVISTLKVLAPNEVCTETYLCIGSLGNAQAANNLRQYMQTKFVRFLLLQALTSINISKDKFQFVPLQDFSKPRTDEELYDKYNLSETERAFIESMIRPME